LLEKPANEIYISDANMQGHIVIPEEMEMK
jgi:hypothetical protein